MPFEKPATTKKPSPRAKGRSHRREKGEALVLFRRYASQIDRHPYLPNHNHNKPHSKEQRVPAVTAGIREHRASDRVYTAGSLISKSGPRKWGDRTGLRPLSSPKWGQHFTYPDSK